MAIITRCLTTKSTTHQKKIITSLQTVKQESSNFNNKGKLPSLLPMVPNRKENENDLKIILVKL